MFSNALSLLKSFSVFTSKSFIYICCLFSFQHSYHPDVREFLMETEDFLITEFVNNVRSTSISVIKLPFNFAQNHYSPVSLN